MDARLVRATVLVASLASLGASYRTPNFIINAPTAEMAQQIGKQAEVYRRDLAQLWLNQTLPNWQQPCPITAQVSEGLGAGGATSFMFDAGEVFGWQMQIQGSLERILDSVLPHEVTHTIFASYFRRPLPRWADEGACTTVEHSSERSKQQQMLVHFLQNRRGIAMHSMFAMKDYPQDVLPLYAQGHSLVSYLIQHGGRQKFLRFIATGLQSEQWPAATQKFYGYANLSELQNSWLDWVRRGSPKIDQPTPPSEAGQESPQFAAAAPRARPEPNLVVRGQSSDADENYAGALVPLSRPRGNERPAPASDMLASAAPIPGPGNWGSSERTSISAEPVAYNPVRMPHPIVPAAQAAPSGQAMPDRSLPVAPVARGAPTDPTPLAFATPAALPGPASGGNAAPSIYQRRSDQPVAAQ